MDIFKKTKELCDKYDIRPARSRGQNFLINEEVYDSIVNLSGVGPEDTVLEIGPGLGFLTAKLSKQAKRVVAVELDDELARILDIALTANNIKNVELVNDDILKYDPKGLGRGYKVVANLPYNITSVFLRTFLSGPRKPASMTLMLQREVAERIVAKEPRMSLLALSVQYFGEPELVLPVPKKDFWPEPAVDSAVVRIENISPRLADGQMEKNMFTLARIGFSSKRKMLKNNLSSGLHLEQGVIKRFLKTSNIKETTRAQELSVEDWLNLAFLVYG